MRSRNVWRITETKNIVVVFVFADMRILAQNFVVKVRYILFTVAHEERLKETIDVQQSQ